MDSEIRWVLNGKIGLPPTATDALEYVESKLKDKEEMQCCINDHRLVLFNKVRELLKQGQVNENNI